MRVCITSCWNPNAWYASSLGKEFNVIESNDPNCTVFFVNDKEERHDDAAIMKSDCYIIPDDKEKSFETLYEGLKKDVIMAAPPEMKKTEPILTPPSMVIGYDHINPNHYKKFSVESIDMMERIYGHEAVINFCELNAFKYSLRMGDKPDQPVERDLAKKKWYLDKANELREKYK